MLPLSVVTRVIACPLHDVFGDEAGETRAAHVTRMLRCSASTVISSLCVAPLSRFESHPFGGLWSLVTGFEVAPGEVQMVVDTYLSDLFDPDTLIDVCTADIDQPDELDFACRLGGALQGVPLEEDEDLFVLEGDFGGAFVRGQPIEVVVDTAPGAT